MSDPLTFSNAHLFVARVLSRDDRFLTLEVAKDDDEIFTVDHEVPDEFLTLLFVRLDEQGKAEIWTPWDIPRHE